MRNMTLIHSPKNENLAAMSNHQLEAWFAAAGLPVDVVENCGDPECPDCRTIEPAQAA